MDEADRSPFGILLRRFRLAAEMTQQQLAERAQLSVEAVSTLERGTRTRPQRGTVLLLGRALQLSPDHLSLLQSAMGVPRPPCNRGHLAGCVVECPGTDAVFQVFHWPRSFIGETSSASACVPQSSVERPGRSRQGAHCARVCRTASRQLWRWRVLGALGEGDRSYQQFRSHRRTPKLSRRWLK